MPLDDEIGVERDAEVLVVHLKIDHILNLISWIRKILLVTSHATHLGDVLDVDADGDDVGRLVVRQLELHVVGRQADPHHLQCKY